MGKRRGRHTRSERLPAHDWSNLLPQPRTPRGPRWLQRVAQWLYRPVGQPPRPDALIELTRVPNRMDAEALVRELHLHDIAAHLFSGDAGGVAPHLGVIQGHRVMVRAGDVRKATEALTHR